MTNNLDTRFISIGDNGQRGVALNQVRGIDFVAIHHTSESCFGQTGTNRLSNLEYANGMFELFLVAIRQSNCRHKLSRQW